MSQALLFLAIFICIWSDSALAAKPKAKEKPKTFPAAEPAAKVSVPAELLAIEKKYLAAKTLEAESPRRTK